MPAATAEIDLAGAVEAPFPGFIPPMLATLATGPFSDPDWLFEVKWDGYRLQAIVNDGVVRTYTRRGLDGATYFPGLLAPATWIAAEQAIVDGEVVALDEDGAPDFGAAPGGDQRPSYRWSGGHHARAARASRYQAFDLLYLDGRSLLRSRSRIASGCSGACSARRPRSASRRTSRPTAWRSTRPPASSGSRASSPSSAAPRTSPGRRSPAWLKIKIRPEQELVVGG